MPDVTINKMQASQQTAQTTQTAAAAPAKKGPGKFARIMSAVAGGALNIVAPGAGTLIAELAGGGGDPMAQVKEMMEKNQESQAKMFALQNEVQNQTQSFTLLTNILKAKHDAEMAAVHNLKS